MKENLPRRVNVLSHGLSEAVGSFRKNGRHVVKELVRRIPVVAEIFRERDALRTENARLKKEAAVYQAGFRLPRDAFMPEELRSDPPQRYAVNNEKYLARGGFVDIRRDVDGFVEGSANNATDLARFYAFCLMFDQVQKDSLSGDIAEIGVYKGHTATLLARFARTSRRTLYLLDTFEGFKSEDLRGIDAKQPVQFSDNDEESVAKFVGRQNVVFIKGRFPETANKLPPSTTYSIVHIDCDLYAPIIACLEYFYPRMTPGGFLVIHDYASLWWAGAEQAVDEFFADKPEAFVSMPDISGSVVVRKNKR